MELHKKFLNSKSKDSFIYNYFLQKDKTSSWIIIIGLFNQFFSMFYLVNCQLTQFGFMQQKISTTNFGYSSIEVLSFLSILNFFLSMFNLSIIRFWYVLGVSYYIKKSQFQIYTIIWYGNIFWCLIKQLLLNIEFSFYSSNICSEENNKIKILNFIINIFNILVLKIFQNQIIVKIVLISSYSFLFIIRCFYFMNNKYIQLFYQYSYLVLCLSGIWSLLSKCIYLSFYSYFLSMFAISLLLLLIKQYFYGEKISYLSIQNNNNWVILNRILFFLYWNIYDEDKLKQIQKLMIINNEDIDALQIKNSRQALINKIIKLIIKNYKQNQFRWQYLKAQIQFKINNNYFYAFKIITLLQNVSKCSYIQQMLLKKLKIQLWQQIGQFKSSKIFAYYQTILQNMLFLQKLFEGAQAYQQLWKNITDTQLIITKIQEATKKVIQKNQQIDHFYKLLQYKSKNSLSFYVQYAYSIERKYQKLISLNNDYQIFLQNYTFNNENHLMIVISLKYDQIGAIQKVSFNVNKILGYQKLEIENKNLDIIIPQIFKKDHGQKLQTQLLRQSHELQNYEKFTVIEDKWTCLLPIKLNMRILYNIIQNELISVGNIQILQKYKKKICIIFKSSTGQIIYNTNNDLNQKKITNISMLSQLNNNQLVKKLLLDQFIFLKIQNPQNTSKLLTFKLFKQVTTQQNQLIIIVQQDIQNIAHQFQIKQEKINLSKFTLSKNSSIFKFLHDKQLFLKNQNYSIRKLLIFPSLIFLILLTFCLINFLIKSNQKFNRFSIIRLTENLINQQMYAEKIYIWNHIIKQNMNNQITFTTVDYSFKPIQNIIPVIQTSIVILREFQQKLTNQIIFNQQDKYSIKCNKLVNSIISSMNYIITYVNYKSLSLINQKIKYIQKNEENWLQDCLPYGKQTLLQKINILKMSSDLFSIVFQTIFIVSYLFLGIFSIFIERKQAKKDYQICKMFTNIDNQDRSKFLKYIKLYINKLKQKQNQLNIDNCLVQRQMISIRRNKDSNMGSLQSSRIMNNTQRTFIKQQNKQYRQQYEIKKDYRKMGQQKIKARTINKALVFKFAIIGISLIILNVFAYVETFKPIYNLTKFTDSIFELQLKFLYYHQKVHAFFESSQQNFQSLQQLHSIYQLQQTSNIDNFNLEDLLNTISVFDPFNKLYHNITYVPLYQYNNLAKYNNLFNSTLQTLTLYQGLQILNLLQGYAGNDSSQILTSTKFEQILLAQQVVIQLQMKLFKVYFHCLNKHSQKQYNNQLFYMQINLLIYFFWLIVIFIPQFLNIMIKKNTTKQMISILDENIYQNQSEN